MDAHEVKELRQQLGWSQGRMARELGIDVGTISRWERGEREPRGLYRKVLEDLAQRPTPSRAPKS